MRKAKVASAVGALLVVWSVVLLVVSGIGSCEQDDPPVEPPVTPVVQPAKTPEAMPEERADDEQIGPGKTGWTWRYLWAFDHEKNVWKACWVAWPLKEEKPVAGQPFPRINVALLHFTADWCPACRQMAPVIKKLAEDGMPIVHIDADQQPDKLAKYQVKQIPTFIVTKDDKEVSRAVGVVPETQLQDMYRSAK